MAAARYTAAAIADWIAQHSPGARAADANCARAKLLRRGQEDFRRRKKLNVRDFGNDPDALKLAFFPAACGRKGQQILIIEMVL